MDPPARRALKKTRDHSMNECGTARAQKLDRKPARKTHMLDIALPNRFRMIEKNTA